MAAAMAFQWSLPALETLMAEDKMDQHAAVLRDFSVVELWRLRRARLHHCPSAWELFCVQKSDAADGKSPLTTGADYGGASPVHVLAPPRPPMMRAHQPAVSYTHLTLPTKRIV